MYQAPTAVWNQIAQSQPLGKPWSRLFRLDLPELTKELAKMEDVLKAKGADARVTRAYLLTAPLLAENEAISSFVEMTNRQDLRSSMPELTSVNEAVILASQEYRLSPSQQAKLTHLLNQAMTSSESAASK